MARVMSNVLVAAICLLCFTVFTPDSQANIAEFVVGCGSFAVFGTCSGTATRSGTVWSTSTALIGIGIVQGGSFTEFNADVTLIVDSATGDGVIAIIGNGGSDFTEFGTITGALTFPPAPFAHPFSLDTFFEFPDIAWRGTLNNKPVNPDQGAFMAVASDGSIDTAIFSGGSATPEPASLLLLGTGFLGLLAAGRWR